MVLQSTIFRALLALLFAALSHARFLPGSFFALRSDPTDLSDNTTLAKRAPLQAGSLPCSPGDVNQEIRYQDPDFRCLNAPSIGDLWTAVGAEGGDLPAGEPAEPPAEPEPPAAPIDITGLFGGPIRELWDALAASQRIATDASGITFWQAGGAVNTDSTLGTNDLCGCTVVLVTSPFACVFAHVLEDRADDNLYWDRPDSEGQQARDVEFLRHASDLVQRMLDFMPSGDPEDPARPPTLENAYNGYFPPDQTSVTVVAPAWNPDYYNQWPAAVRMQQGDWVYPNQVGQLGIAITALVSPGDQSRVSSVGYRRRYWSTDPMHQADDRDLVVIAPVPNDDGSIDAVVFYDDSEQMPVARIADPPRDGARKAKKV